MSTALKTVVAKLFLNPSDYLDCGSKHRNMANLELKENVRLVSDTLANLIQDDIMFDIRAGDYGTLLLSVSFSDDWEFEEE